MSGQSIQYKQSKYNLRQDTDASILLYNTRCGSFIEIPQEVAAVAETILNSPNDDFSGPDQEVFNLLLENDFIIDANINEFAEIKNRYYSVRNNANEHIITILPSEACNFRCPYCFIYKQRNITMGEEVYQSILVYIEKNVQTGSNLIIAWFGGEPTLAKEKIIGFMTKLQKIASEKSIHLHSKMLTNGYLLNSKTFTEFVRAGITDFQITIDGAKETHDKVRCLASGQGSFDQIWHNMVAIKEITPKAEFKLKVRINFLKGYDRHIQEFTDNFRGIFGSDERFSLYFRPVFKWETDKNEVDKIAEELFTPEEGKDKQIEYMIANRDICLPPEFTDHVTAPLPDPVYVWCNAEMENSITVAADGKIYKCDTCIGNADLACGRLDQDGKLIMKTTKDDEFAKSIYDYENLPCFDCVYLPICQGGCARDRMKRIQENNCYYNSKTILNAMISSAAANSR